MGYRPEYGPPDLSRREPGEGQPGAPSHITPQIAALVAGEGVVVLDSRSRVVRGNGRPGRLNVFSGKVRDFLPRKDTSSGNNEGRKTIVNDGDDLYMVDLEGNKEPLE